MSENIYNPAAKKPAPTIVRYGVLVFLAVAASSAYLTRHCLGVMNTSMQEELGINNEQFGYLYSAFSFGYLLFQVPGGWLAQKFGTRITMPMLSTFWSLCTIVTAAVSSLWLIIGSRFLFGLAQAGLVPNSAKVVKDWFPERTRAKVSSVVAMSMSLGGVITTLLTAHLIMEHDWRDILRWYSMVGIIWAVLFFLYFRTRPKQHLWVNPYEREFIETGKDPSGRPESPRIYGITNMFLGASVAGICAVSIWGNLPLAENFAKLLWHDPRGGLVLGCLTLCSGIGLAQYRAWGRWLAVIAGGGIFCCLAYGIYFLWPTIILIPASLTSSSVPFEFKVTVVLMGAIFVGGLVYSTLMVLALQNRANASACDAVPAKDKTSTRVNSIDETAVTEASSSPGFSWAAAFRERNTWALCGQLIFKAAGYNFFVTFFPAFLEYKYGITKADAGMLTTYPLIGVVLGSLCGGMVVDGLFNKTGSKYLSRCVVAAVALGLTASFAFGSTFTDNAQDLAKVIAIGSFFSGMAMPCPWAASIDMGGKNPALVMGMMNAAGCLAGICISPYVGKLIDHIKATGGNWDIVVYVHAAFYLLAALLWLVVNPNKNIGHSAEAAEAKGDV